MTARTLPAAAHELWIGDRITHGGDGGATIVDHVEVDGVVRLCLDDGRTVHVDAHESVTVIRS